MTDIINKILYKEYETKLEYPHSLPARKASPEEIKQYREQADAWGQDQNRLDKLFRGPGEGILYDATS